MLIASAGLFGIFLFLTYYLQQTLSYSPLVTGVAFLPLSAGLIIAANLSTTVLMPRTGPRPLVASGMLAAAGAMAWLAQLGPHTAYAGGVLGPTILAGIGIGLVIAPAINTGTFGVAPQDAGVASATVTVGQQLGASVGTSLLNTIFAAAVTSYLAAHLAAARLTGRPAPNRLALTGLALAHGYDTAFWWTAGIFAAGAVTAGALLRRGPLRPASTPPPAHAQVTPAQAKADPALPGLQGHAGHRDAISEQSVLDLEIAGGRVCHAGLLVGTQPGSSAFDRTPVHSRATAKARTTSNSLLSAGTGRAR
jgi:MFS family permease